MKVLRGTYLPDCHVHTAFSTDSEANPAETVMQAAALGMPLICITDHHDMDYPGGEFQLDVPLYKEKTEELKDFFADRIEVLRGVELGLQPYLAGTGRLEQFAEEGGYDYVIGSVHLVDGKDPYVREDFDMTDTELYTRYFEQTLECVQKLSGFQTLGHLDYIVRYGYGKDKEYSYIKYRDVLDAVLETLIRRDIALEVNTAGYRKGLDFPNPHPDILWRYHDLGGEKITLGSDAHEPENTGADFAKAAELLQAIGFRYITVFHGQEESGIPIDVNYTHT